MEQFITHGVYTLTNTMGYEVQLSECGDAARLKDGNNITDWLEIEFVEDEDDSDVTNPVIDPDGYNVALNLVIRV
jgi:hypothetical protein